MSDTTRRSARRICACDAAYSQDSTQARAPATDPAGRPAVRSHTEAVAVASDATLFSSRVSRFLQVPNGLDGEEHRMMRGLLAPFFFPAALKELQPRLEKTAARLIETRRPERALCAVHELGSLYAVHAQSTWLGWCPEIEDELVEWVEANHEATRSGALERTREVARWFDRIMRDLIAGPSSSGKTSFSKRLAIQLQALGKKPHPISVDNYFINRALAPRDENGNYDFESIGSVDLPTFNRDMAALLRGESVELPRYNFFTGEREYKGDFRKLSRDDILVIEGIHCLNPLMSESLPEEAKFRVYISALTQLNIDEHNRIPSTDARLIRRMVRDNRTRGYSAEDTISMWKNVRRGEERNIFPYQERADVMVNSAMLYELPVLKIFAEPILFQIKESSPAWQEAKRLLKFLDYMLPISPEFIPQNSIVREFIGGSCLDVG